MIAVFPVAGLGTRFLPATKAMPKEMLPIVDKPLIQYAVEEAVASGCTKLVFVTGRNKRAIEDHFDRQPELEAHLEQNGRKEILEAIRHIVPSHVTCVFIRQSEPLGLGHAVRVAEPVIDQQYFAVLLADDFIDADKPVLKEMKKQAFGFMVPVYEDRARSVIAVENVPQGLASQYGIVEHSKDDVIKVIHEKPKVAPTNLAVVGRYILDRAVLEYLQVPGSGGEIQLTDGINAMIRQGRECISYRHKGQRFDCGSKAGFVTANLAMALKDPELRRDVDDFLTSWGWQP